MGTTIDSIQIEIQSGSINAAQGITDLSKALGELKKNGSIGTAAKNLQKLSDSLNGFTGAYQASNSLRNLANSIEKLKSVGSIASLANSLAKLPKALESLGAIDIKTNVTAQISSLVEAVAPLSSVKTSGFTSMVNSLKKLGEVTKSLDENDTLNEFIKRVEKLNEKLAPLSQKMTTIKTGFSSVNTNARKATSSVKEFADGVDSSKLNMASFIEIARTAVGALQNLIQQFAEITDKAIQWDGVAARFGRGFGAQAQETYAWIQRLNDELGINIQQFMQHSSVYATMLTGFGVASKDASKMALGYMELTYDIWAGYNDIYKTLDEAAEAVRSAIAGEVEPVRKAGFTIIESTLQQTAANHGLEISLEKATEAQKSYLRYLTLVDQAQAQSLIGTYAKEMNTAEGLMRTFAQQVKSLAQAFGSLFLPILTKVMPYLQAVVDLLADGVRWLGRMFGIEIQAVDWSGYNSGVTDAVENTQGVTGALNDATKAAKELKNASIGLDELNVISPPTSSSGGVGGAGSGSGGTGFENIDIDSLWDDSIFDGVKNKVSDIVKNMKDWLGITDDIDSWADFFETRLGQILIVVGEIGLGISAWKVSKTLIDSIATLKTLLANPYYAITIGAILTIAGVTFTYQGMEDAIKNGLDGFNFAEIVGGSLFTTGGVAILGSKLATWISTAFTGSAVDLAITQAGINLGVGTAGAAGAALASAVAGIVLGIPAMFVGIYDACMNGLDWLNGLLIPAGSTAASAGIGAIIGALGGPIGAGVGALIGLAVGLVTDGVILIVQEWDKISAFFSKFFTETIPELWDDFVGWCEGVGEFFTKDIPTFFTETIPEWGNEIFYGLGYALGEGARAVYDWWNDDVVPFFTKDIPNFFTETIPDWGTQLWNGITSAFNTATRAISSWWNDDVVPFFTKTIPNFFTSDLPGFFASLPGTFKEVGESIIDGLWEGVTGAWTWLKETIGGWCGNFVQGFKDAFGIHSPSTVFAGLGENIVAGLQSTLGITSVTEKFSEMWENAKSWWNGSKETLNTYTPSIGDIKGKLSSAWSSAKSWWDNKKAALKSYTPSIGSIYEKVKERWDSARTWWNNKKSAMKAYTPSIGSIYEKVSERWKNARDWWNGKKGSFKSYTPSIGSITEKVKSAWNSAKSWWNKNVKLSTKLDIKVPKIKVNWDTASAFGKSFKYPTGFKLDFAADGGMFNAGSLIWAGERGAEIVANASGGKTGVMNVQQMQDAVYEGVYAAVIAAMRGYSGGGEQSVNVYLDGKQITSVVEKRQRERGASIMGNEVYSY
ncbi:MAG: glycine zipper family protein [Clostridia bacterium]|nr:glycine zipper family protein [Clostridia bacterium]